MKMSADKLAVGVAVILAVGAIQLAWNWTRPAVAPLSVEECISQALAYLPQPVVASDRDKLVATCEAEY